MSHEVIPANLRRLREANTLSQAELAQASGLSREAYRNLENGKSIPRVDTLQAIADALNVKIQELISPVLQLHRVRFRALKKLKSREQIISRTTRWLKDFNEIESILDNKATYKLRDLTISQEERTPQYLKALAQEIRNQLGILDREPIRDICGLLESNGIKILPISIASDAFFGLSVAEEEGGPAIVINTWERISVERWIFTAAHELAHLLLHLNAYKITETAENSLEENEANTLASYFLMPEEVFKREWDKTAGLSIAERVLHVKRIFMVSYKTVLYRLSQSSSIGNKIWQLFYTDYRRRYGRTLLKADEPNPISSKEFQYSNQNLPEHLRAHEPEELSSMDFKESRLWKLVHDGVEKEKITLARGAEILNLSLDEMRELSKFWVDNAHSS